MDLHAMVTLGILGVAGVLFLSDRIRPDVVGLSVAVGLGLTGVLTPAEALAGLSSPAVVTILAVFMLAEGLRRTGVTERLGTVLLRLARSGEGGLVGVVMAAAAALSLFMNNTAAASLLLPAAASAARRAGVSLSRLLMPLAFATLLGGMATLLTTSNIIAAGILRDNGYRAYGLLDFAPVGLPLVALGVAYMALWGRRTLPRLTPAEDIPPVRTPVDLAQVYRLGERMLRAAVRDDSPLVGRTLADSAFRELCGATVVAIDRGGRIHLAPPPTARLEAGDVLILEGRREPVESDRLRQCLWPMPLEPVPTEGLESASVALVETVLSPRSGLIGHSLANAHFREKYGMTALALWRAGKPMRTGIRDQVLQFGDALLLQGPRDRLGVLRAEPDLIVLGGAADAPPVSNRGWLAAGVLLVTLALVTTGWLPMAVGLLAGSLAMILTRVMTADEAYRSIEWRTVFLVAGMLPASTALVKTGAAGLLAGTLVRAAGTAGSHAALAGVFLLTALLTQVMSGTAVAAVLTPVAILVARGAGMDPRALVMAVALACSMAFLTPLGHPVNLLVMGPAGYGVRDFLRVGTPLFLLLFLAAMVLLPLAWPLTPP